MSSHYEAERRSMVLMSATRQRVRFVGVALTYYPWYTYIYGWIDGSVDTSWNGEGQAEVFCDRGDTRYVNPHELQQIDWIADMPK